jgi:hypothetical protein
VTDAQRGFLQRAAELARHDMAIMPRGTLQHRMAALLEQQRMLVYVGMAIHEETGMEGPSWRITDEGHRALAAKDHE